MTLQTNLKYSVQDIIQELCKDQNIIDTDDIILLKMGDKFFIGGGCEATTLVIKPSITDKKFSLNISVCADIPIDRICN